MCRFVGNSVYLKKVAVSTGALLLALQRFYIIEYYGLSKTVRNNIFGLLFHYRKFTINYDVLQCGEPTNT